MTADLVWYGFVSTSQPAYGPALLVPAESTMNRFDAPPGGCTANDAERAITSAEAWSCTASELVASPTARTSDASVVTTCAFAVPAFVRWAASTRTPPGNRRKPAVANEPEPPAPAPKPRPLVGIET